jgi:CRISPR-associated exonuclease Cas4
MSEYDTSPDPIYISALQHYLFCPRQCALIHVEQAWAENRFTAEGRLLHERTDKPKIEKRKGVRTVTAMPLASEALGITGIADVVEFHSSGNTEYPYPVEYKRGKPKAHRADEVQLCAQALCLEEMYGVPCSEGALYYGETRRRDVVLFDEALRELTKDTIRATHHLIESGKTPLPDWSAKRCSSCSLNGTCQPKQMGSGKDVETWLKRKLKTSLEQE